jgi:N-glycosylase/DNA lyase
MKKSEVLEHYQEKQQEIESRLEEFRELRDSDEPRKFLELVFVILTSQTGAEKSWEATSELERRDLLTSGDEDSIKKILEKHSVQYADEKASYIVDNYENLSQPTLTDPEKKLKISEKIKAEDLDSSREWFAENVKGIGWKGASHFLRNIGYGDSFAIISSHIIDVMAEIGLLENPKPPGNMEEYLEMEKRLNEFSEEIGIDIQALDLVLWSMRTGEVFK